MAPTEPSRRSIGLVDIGAGVAVVLALVGVIWSPKLSGAIAKASGALEPVTVLVDVRGVASADPNGLIAAARQAGKVSIVIRNEPHGTVDVKEIIPLQRRLSAVLPSGKVVSAPDPNQAVFGTLDARFVLKAEGRKTGGGVVFGNQNIKIGAPIELEGDQFRVSGVVSGLKLGAS